MQNVLPLRGNSRKRTQFFNSMSFPTQSTTTPLLAPKVGLLSGIWVNFTGVVTAAAGAAFTKEGPFGLFNRLTLTLNQGNITIFDLTGKGAYCYQIATRFGGGANKAGMGDTTPHRLEYVAPLAVGANDWNLTLFIPVSANDGLNFETGLIPLQAAETQCFLNVKTGGATDNTFASNITNITGTISVYYDYFEVPPAGVALPPPMIVRALEDITPITVVGGANDYIVPREGFNLQFINMLEINGAPADPAVFAASQQITSTQLILNQADTAYDAPIAIHKMRQRLLFGSELPDGVYIHDFFSATGIPNSGDFRDVWNGMALADFRVRYQTGSGAVLGVGNNFIRTVRRIVQKFQYQLPGVN